MNKTTIMTIVTVMIASCCVLHAGPLIFVARKHQIQRAKSALSLRLLELQGDRNAKRAKRLKKYLDCLANNSFPKEKNRFQCELMGDIQSKIKDVSKRMYDIKGDREWQRNYWMERAKKSRRDGYEILAKQYENFVKYKMTSGKDEVNEKSLDEKRGAENGR